MTQKHDRLGPADDDGQRGAPGATPDDGDAGPRDGLGLHLPLLGALGVDAQLPGALGLDMPLAD
jgi:hypothetical protein